MRPGSSVTLEHLEQLIVVCPVAIAHIDARHHIRYCNPAFESLFGFRAREAVGRKLESLIGIEDAGSPIALGRGRGEPLHHAARARRKNAASIDIEVDIIPKSTSRPAGYWALFHDATPLRRAEVTLSKLTQTMIEAQERERFGIAKALHDDVAQRLTVLQIGIERLKTDASARAAFKAQLEHLQTEAKGVTAGVRALSLGLDVPTLSLLAIDKALERLCDDVGARRGIRIHFTSSHLRRSVPHDVSLALFRVVQDALRLPQESHARPIHIVLTGSSGVIQLSIRGLASLRIDESGLALRLLIMRERAAMVNGTFSTAAPPEGGTD